VVSCTDNFCYYLTSKQLSWTEAVKECRKFNADLVSIHSEVDQQWIITNILTPQSLDEIYIGMNIKCYLALIKTHFLATMFLVDTFFHASTEEPRNKCGILEEPCFPMYDGQTREHCFSAMFSDGWQTRKHCFLAMSPDGGQTREHCFSAMFSDGGKPGNIVS
jgi:hypothetical protein